MYMTRRATYQGSIIRVPTIIPGSWSMADIMCSPSTLVRVRGCDVCVQHVVALLEPAPAAGHYVRADLRSGPACQHRCRCSRDFSAPTPCRTVPGGVAGEHHSSSSG
jgi:hypothetical protein